MLDFPGIGDLQPYETWKFRTSPESVFGVFPDLFRILLRKCLTVLGAPPNCKRNVFVIVSRRSVRSKVALLVHASSLFPLRLGCGRASRLQHELRVMSQLDLLKPSKPQNMKVTLKLPSTHIKECVTITHTQKLLLFREMVLGLFCSFPKSHIWVTFACH